MKALLNIQHTIEVNHIRYYEWVLHIISNGFIGRLKGRKNFDCQHNALRSARRAAKKLGINIISVHSNNLSNHNKSIQTEAKGSADP